MDCELVLDLDERVKNQTTSRAMGNVCLTPLTFIWTRGQGVKLQSLVFNECRKRNQRILNLPNYSARVAIKDSIREWNRPAFVAAEYEREFEQMDQEERDIRRIRDPPSRNEAMSLHHMRLTRLRAEYKELQHSMSQVARAQGDANPLMAATSQWVPPKSLALRESVLKEAADALAFLTDEYDVEMDG